MSGKKYQDVGKDTEQNVARYLRGRGLAGVERAVRTGFRTAERAVQDAGDLTGWPGVCVQVKSLRPANRAERALPQWLAELELQHQQSGASVGLLVVRRWGTTDVGEWWCFLTLGALMGMADGHCPPELGLLPVRLELSDAVSMMQTYGWAPCPAVEPLEGTA